MTDQRSAGVFSRSMSVSWSPGTLIYRPLSRLKASWSCTEFPSDFTTAAVQRLARSVRAKSSAHSQNKAVKDVMFHAAAD